MTENNSEDFSDRRKFPRIRGALVEYALSQDGPYQQPAFIKDISIGGVCIYLREQLQKDINLYLKIHFENSMSPIEVKGKLAWQSKSSYIHYFDVGIQFFELSDEASQQISEYVSVHLPKKQ